jgi:hypothetical protein
MRGDWEYIGKLFGKGWTSRFGIPLYFIPKPMETKIFK